MINAVPFGIVSVKSSAKIWDLSNKASNKLWITWNNIIRSIFNLPPTTHCYLISPISKQDHLKLTLIHRFRRFFEKISSYKNTHIQTLVGIQCRDMRSVFGRNVALLARDNNIYPVPPGEQERSGILEKLLGVRDKYLELHGGEMGNINDWIDILTTF